MYYIITDNGVIAGRSRKLVEKRLKGSLTDEQFTAVGSDYVSKLTSNDIDFVRDIGILESIPIQQLFKPDNRPMLLQVAILILTVIILVSK